MASEMNQQFAPLTEFNSVLAILSTISLFGGTTEDQLKVIFQQLQSGIVPKGEYVFREGDDPFYIYIVKSGKLDLLLREEDTVVDVYELKAGDCFGEASIMSMHKHSASAIAKEDSEIMVLSRRALIDLKHTHLELFALLMMNIARELARRLHLTDTMLLHYLRKKGDAATPPRTA